MSAFSEVISNLRDFLSLEEGEYADGEVVLGWLGVANDRHVTPCNVVLRILINGFKDSDDHAGQTAYHACCEALVAQDYPHPSPLKAT
jgi:hypothetical protein